MAWFTLGHVQNQVQLLTGHDGLADKVTRWTNRVMNEIVLKAYWVSSMGVTYAIPGSGMKDSTVPNQWFSVDPVTVHFHEFVAPYAADRVVMKDATWISKYIRPLIRLDIMDMYAAVQGTTVAAQAGVPAEYGMVYGDVNTSGTPRQYLWAAPAFGTTVTTASGGGGGVVAVSYLGTPLLLVSGTDTNWILSDYFKVVLAGVMRYARVYLGDYQGYLLEKAEFENGLRDMLLHEETASASTPRMQGLNPEVLGRND